MLLAQFIYRLFICHFKAQTGDARTDGGNVLLTTQQADDIVKKEEDRRRHRRHMEDQVIR